MNNFINKRSLSRLFFMILEVAADKPPNAPGDYNIIVSFPTDIRIRFDGDEYDIRLARVRAALVSYYQDKTGHIHNSCHVVLISTRCYFIMNVDGEIKMVRRIFTNLDKCLCTRYGFFENEQCWDCNHQERLRLQQQWQQTQHRITIPIMNKFVTRKAYIKLFFITLDLAFAETNNSTQGNIGRRFDHKITFETPVIIRYSDEEYIVTAAYICNHLVESDKRGKFIHEYHSIVFENDSLYILINVKGEVRISSRAADNFPTCNSCLTIPIGFQRYTSFQKKPYRRDIHERVLKYHEKIITPIVDERPAHGIDH